MARRAVRVFSITLILCAGASLGCDRNPARPSQLPLGQPFGLRVGASVILRGGLTVRFDRVKSDSRCPTNALCVWAGDAIVVVSLSQAAGSEMQRELHTAAAASETSYLGYSIRLVALAPYPRLDWKIEQQDYVATFTVAAGQPAI